MPVPTWYHLPSTSRVGGSFFHLVETPASAWVDSIPETATFRDMAAGARMALQLDPGCIEAHLVLAETTTDGWLRHAHLVKAVETGRKLWNSVFRKDTDLAWWGVGATRPYMRAVDRLAICCADYGDRTEAVRLHRKLLRMNPYDNQGIRFRVGMSTAEIITSTETIPPHKTERQIHQSGPLA